MNPLQVTLSLAGIVLIIIACYYTTWFISTRASGQGRSRLRKKNINLVDRFAISKDKGFYLVEIAGKAYIVGITNQSMTLLDTLDAAVLAESGAEHGDTAEWRMSLGGRIASQTIKKLASFLNNATGRQLKTRKGASGAIFAESMRSAHAKNASNQPPDYAKSVEGMANVNDPANIGSEGET